MQSGEPMSIHDKLTELNESFDLFKNAIKEISLDEWNSRLMNQCCQDLLSHIENLNQIYEMLIHQVNSLFNAYYSNNENMSDQYGFDLNQFVERYGKDNSMLGELRLQVGDYWEMFMEVPPDDIDRDDYKLFSEKLRNLYLKFESSKNIIQVHVDEFKDLERKYQLLNPEPSQIHMVANQPMIDVSRADLFKAKSTRSGRPRFFVDDFYAEDSSVAKKGRLQSPADEKSDEIEADQKRQRSGRKKT